jgi:hypothetical protein
VDLNVRAFRVVQEAINGHSPASKKKEAARQGGLKGGPSRALSISAERRREIAQKASKARWATRASVKGTLPEGR